MEKTPKPSFEKFEQNGVLKSVLETTRNIALTLSDMGISSEVQKYNTSLLILIKEADEISDATARTAIEGHEKPGIKISFNMAEQIIRVSPTKN